MPSQPDATREPTREVPAEVPAQLRMNVALLDAANEYWSLLDEATRARVDAMSDEEAHEQYVAFLALMPSSTRARILRCNIFLLALVEEISRSQGDPGPADPSPPGAPLRLASCPESEAAG